MKEQQSTKKEKVQSVIIAVLTLVIILGGAYFASELKYCEVKEPVEILQDIGMTEFTTLLNEEEPSIIYVARPGCGYCQQQKPIMEDVASEYALAVHYLNTDNLTETEVNSLITMIEKATEDEFGTPTTLIVQSGKIVDFVVGLNSNDGLVDLFTKNGFIK